MTETLKLVEVSCTLERAFTALFSPFHPLAGALQYGRAPQSPWDGAAVLPAWLNPEASSPWKR